MNAAIIGLPLSGKTTVFEAATGYLLAEELKGELTWVYEQDFIATEYDHSFELIPSASSSGDPDFIIVTETIERTFKNITDSPRDIAIHLGSPEWFRLGFSTRIVHFYCSQGDRTWDMNKLNMRRKPNCTLSAELQDNPVTVPPKSEIRVLWKLQAAKHKSDECHTYFGVGSMFAAAS